MALHHNVSATWKNIVPWQNVAGTWKKLAVWQNVAATWKQLTYLLGVNLPTSLFLGPFAISTGDAQWTFNVNSDGTYSGYEGGTLSFSGTWMLGGSGGDYQVMLETATVGGGVTGDAIDTWLALSASRQWVQLETRNGYYTKYYTGLVRIRQAAAPNTEFDTATVDFSATVEV
jgi:hypothetical protein